MNRRFILIILFCLNGFGQPPTPFQKGVNLTNWFQVSNAQHINLNRYDRNDFIDLQSLGVDVIRLPINLHAMTSGAPDWQVDPLLLVLLDEVVNWTEDLGLHLILDNHTFDPSVATTATIHQPLAAIWPQLAQHFLDRDSTLYFEILNEPHGIDDVTWNTIQQYVVGLIREVDPDRKLIVGPAGWNSYNNLNAMPIYDDDNLIYTFHFYDPFLFTHQGASWTDPSMVSLAGVPFPGNAASVPACPPDLQGTWVQGSLASYGSYWTVARVQELLDIAIDFGQTRNVPVFCGEFGVMMNNADPEHRVNWYQEVSQYLDAAHVGWTMWDYHGAFGLFELGGTGLFNHDLNAALAEAVGFTPPPQTPFEVVADTQGFYLYDDFIGADIMGDFYSSGDLNLYATDDPYRGSFAISWTQATQYDRITFRFSPYKDLSQLVAEDHVLTLHVKGEGDPRAFDLRFLDTKTSTGDHPWRMGITLSRSDLNWDGNYEYLQIPLSTLTELGSWDGSWYGPQGLYDWTATDLFEIVAEREDFGSSQLWFDEIRIVDPLTASTREALCALASSQLLRNFPNPFNPSTNLEYVLGHSGNVELAIFDLQGRQVESLVMEEQEAGVHRVAWEPSSSTIGAGIYVARLRTEYQESSIKLLLLK